LSGTRECAGVAEVKQAGGRRRKAAAVGSWEKIRHNNLDRV